MSVWKKIVKLYKKNNKEEFLENLKMFPYQDLKKTYDAIGHSIIMGGGQPDSLYEFRQMLGEGMHECNLSFKKIVLESMDEALPLIQKWKAGEQLSTLESVSLTTALKFAYDYVSEYDFVFERGYKQDEEIESK